MTKESTLRKFTSRKFLMAISTVLIVLFEGSGVEEKTILAALTGIYIFAQAIVDRAEQSNVGVVVVGNAQNKESEEVS